MIGDWMQDNSLQRTYNEGWSLANHILTWHILIIFDYLWYIDWFIDRFAESWCFPASFFDWLRSCACSKALHNTCWLELPVAAGVAPRWGLGKERGVLSDHSHHSVEIWSPLSLVDWSVIMNSPVAQDTDSNRPANTQPPIFGDLSWLVPLGWERPGEGAWAGGQHGHGLCACQATAEPLRGEISVHGWRAWRLSFWISFQRIKDDMLAKGVRLAHQMGANAKFRCGIGASVWWIWKSIVEVLPKERKWGSAIPWRCHFEKKSHRSLAMSKDAHGMQPFIRP